MTIEQPTQTNPHELLVAKLDVETDAVKNILGEKFSSDTYEAWLLENGNKLHEAVEKADVKAKILEFASLNEENIDKDKVKQQAVDLILTDLKMAA